MLSFENVSFGYGLRRSVLRELSLTIDEGERIRLCGASGQGKTTALRLLMGLEKPRRGVVNVPAGTRFSAVFQEDRLLPWKTVLENVSLFSDETTARAVLCHLGLEEVCRAYPNELSGGMKRRSALARALCHPFDVLVLDEPLTGLDEASRRICLDAIDETVGARTLVLASHDEGDGLYLRTRDIPLR